jgi:hypothetical protein
MVDLAQIKCMQDQDAAGYDIPKIENGSPSLRGTL